MSELTTDQRLRLEALTWAVRGSEGYTDQINAAQGFYDFLTAKPAEEHA